MTSTPSPAATAEARPVDASERVTLIDVLRGAALCGIFVSNAAMHFSGQELLPHARAEALASSAVDVVASKILELFVYEKAMTTFSFLFGLGFAVQLGRARERGASIVPLYLRRLVVLFLIGLTHLFALWYGDVLTLYASTGFALLLFRDVPDRRVLAWSIALMIFGTAGVPAVLRFTPLLASSPEVVQAAAQETMGRAAAIRAQTLEAFSGSSYLAILRANANFYLRLFLNPMMLSYALVTLGRFLLGLLAGRRRIFHDVEPHLPFFRRLLGWSLVAAVAGNALQPLLFRLTTINVIPKRSPQLMLLLTSTWGLAVLGTAAVYVAGITLLFQRPRWRRWLSLFAPPGRMALTNYLSQSVLSELVFYGYGLGLMGKTGPAAHLAIFTGLYGVQILVSHLWLARFRFGPIEWLWRSLTYGKLQPMRRAETRAAEGVSA